MKNALLAMAAAVAVGVGGIATAEAQSRIGFGFGVPFSSRPPIADPTILERAERTRQRRLERQRATIAPDRRQVHNDRATAREAQRQATAAAAKARAEKVAAAKAEAGARKAQASKSAAAPAVAAPAAAPNINETDKALLAAQEQQRIKADEMLKSLKQTSAPAPARPAVTAAPSKSPRVSGGDSGPFDTGAPSAPVAPTSVKGAPAAAPARPAPVVTGDCRRFIPGAGITVTVPCSE